MAAAASSLRPCLRSSWGTPAFRNVVVPKAPIIPRRCLTSTAARRMDEAEYARRYHKSLSEEAKAAVQEIKSNPDMQREIWGINSAVSALKKQPLKRNIQVWNEEEEDPDLITDNIPDDFEEDDMLSMAHGKLEEHREFREYARVTVWEMPLLSKFAKPFVPPDQDQVLRFRYTSYMGEFHPAEKKVVVELSPRDLPLTEPQQLKLKKLAGPRFNPETEIVRMSCEMFENQAQNKRYLGDLVEKLIAEAKDPTDMFEDIPLDTRHHTVKTKPKFPVEWRMTEERRKQLAELRQQAQLLDETKKAQGTLVDGMAKIQLALEPPRRDRADRTPEMVPVMARGRPQGRQQPVRR